MSKRPAVAVAEKPTGDPASLGAMIPIDGEETVSLAGPGSVDLGIATVTGEEIPQRLHMVEEVTPRQPFVPPRRTNGSATPKAAAVVSPKREITRLLPSAHRIYVYKVKDDGKQTFCSEYSAQELQGSGTIEAFLRKFVVHEYEYGAFNLYLYDGSTENPKPIGSVTIEAPASHKAAVLNGGNGHGRGTDSLKELYELQKEMADTVQKQAQANAQPQKSASEEYRDMMKSMAEMKTMFGGDGKSGGDPMSPMMMWMMMQQRPVPQPQVDPALSRMMEKVMERIENMEREQQMLAIQPPPMMPEGRSQSELLVQMMQENTRVLIAAMQGNQDKRDPIMDLANLAKLIESKNDSLTIKDIFTMIPQIKEMVAPAGATSDPFQKTVENFRLFKLMQREFGEDRPAGGQQQPPQDNFFTFAKGLLQSDVGKSIAAQIMQQGAGQEAARMHDQRRLHQQRQAQQVANQRQQQQRARAQAALPPGQPRAEPQGNQAVSGIPQAVAPAPQAVSQAAPVPQAAPPPPRPQAPPQPPVQAQEEEEDEDENLEVPEGFLDVHAPAINSAANSAERIGAIINGLQLLGTSKDFRPHLSKMFNFLKVNRKIEALEILHELLEFFADNEVLDKKIPDQARADFAEHWALIRMNLQFPEVPEVFPEGHEGAATAPAEPEQEQAAS